MSASDLRRVYLDKALHQIPRLLSLQDRNPFSPTYGSFHRLHWLDKASDFPDAMAQFGVQTLALVYAHEIPGNPYYRQPKVRDWAIAGLDYWAQIQHADGSFDEFYPYERGWAGPTGFTLYAALEAYRLLGDEIPSEVARRLIVAFRRAAYFLAAGEAEEDHLANHHALACLAVWTAYRTLGEPDLKAGFDRLWRGFLTYHKPGEGWSVEYDGADPGYLSATVSFLARIYQTHPAPEILEVLRSAVEFASYFAYPNGYYGGSIGSRQTLHFYPHGCELIAGQVPLAGALAQAMLEGLAAGTLVPPEIMPDRYLAWRMAELLQAHLDASPRSAALPVLPYQRPPFRRWFPEAGIYVARGAGTYLLANLAKGGVVKLFSTESGRLLYNDCGILGTLVGGQLVSSQWIDPTYQIAVSDEQLSIRGSLQRMSSTRSFTPMKLALFRGVLATVGRSPRASHLIKGAIRKALMLGTRPIPAHFDRRIRLGDDALTVVDHVRLAGPVRLAGLMFGDEFAVRYVPQSRYFQAQELGVSGYRLTPEQLAALNARRSVTVSRRVEIPSGRIEVRVGETPATDVACPAGSAGSSDAETAPAEFSRSPRPRR